MATHHLAQVMAGRRRYFERMDEAYMALWWVPAGHRPTVAEAKERVDLIRRLGPTPDAFTFRSRIPPPGDHRPPAAGSVADPGGHPVG